MTDIDARLRAHFARAAVPADPSGVADIIRARIAAGDAGTRASSNEFGSWYLSGPFRRWLPWLAVLVVTLLVVVTASVGGAFGTSGWFNADGPSGVAPATSVSSTDPTPSAAQTPSPTASAEPSATPTPATTASASSTPSATAAAPKPPTQPAPVDSSVPLIQQYSVTPTDVYNGEVVIAEVIASDNVGVTSVTVTWVGQTTQGSGTMTSLGSGRWALSFNPSTDDYGMYTVTMRAKDARGNKSAPVSAQFQHIFFG